MDTGFCQVPEIFPGSYKPPLLFWVSESSALNRGTGPSDYIETRKGIWYKEDKLMSVPIEAVIVMMMGFIQTIVLLIIELINAKK